MTEVTLTLKEFEILAEAARRKFVNDPVNKYTGNHFLAKCYLEAVLELITKKNLVVSNNKLYEQNN